jgi:hypothetical protein
MQSIQKLVIFLCSAICFIISSQLAVAQNTGTPYPGTIPPDTTRRSRFSNPSPPRFKLIRQAAGITDDAHDLAIDATWEGLDGNRITITIVGSPKKEGGGVYFISRTSEQFTVGFGRSPKPIEYLRSQRYKVQSSLTDLETPYVLKMKLESFEVVENYSKAKRLFAIFQNWFYNTAVPTLRKQPLLSNEGYTDDELFDALELTYPEKFWWEYPLVDTRSVA